MTTKINSNLLLEVLEATPSLQNIMLMGKHGVGKSQILEKYFTARGRGSSHFFLVRWQTLATLSGFRTKTMNYKRILAQFRSSVTSDSRTLIRTRPNRRYGFDFMGSRYKPNFRILVAVDSSGSISNEDLENFFSIINRFFKYGAKEIKVIVFDVEIQQEMDFKKAKTALEVKGRGGTDFQAAIDYYEKSDFDGLIIFTDGYAARPKITKKAENLVDFER